VFARLKTLPLVSPAILYLFFAALMGMACILLTPPGQVPDERNHFARITQISQGGIVGFKKGTREAGGYLAENFPSELELLGDLHSNTAMKMPMTEFLALSERRWADQRSWFSFPNTVIYAPVTYLPAAFVTWIGRHAHFRIIDTLYLVRLANMASMLALCALGIALARRGTLLLIVLSSLPMALALGGSCSQDGVLIGLSVLTAALITRFDRDNPGGIRAWVVIGILFGILTISKPPLLLCSLVPLGLSLPNARLVRGIPFACSVAAFEIWNRLALKPTKIEFTDRTGVSDSGQIAWILSHPFDLPGLAVRSLRSNLGHTIHEFFGVLGWLDIVLPHGYYRLIYLAVVLAVAVSLLPGLRERAALQSLTSVSVTILAMLLAVGAVYFSIYVIWTPVGAPVVDGIQGRYFLPIAPFLVVAFPRAARAGQIGASRLMHQGIMAVTALFLAADTLALTCVLAARYW